jgi:hypothetical protein
MTDLISMHPENPGRISMAMWAEVNDRLAEMGMDEATWGDIRPLVGWSAQGAAEHIADLRRDTARWTAKTARQRVGGTFGT